MSRFSLRKDELTPFERPAAESGYLKTIVALVVGALKQLCNAVLAVSKTGWRARRRSPTARRVNSKDRLDPKLEQQQQFQDEEGPWEG